jgi:CRP/FNR family transcriptional regulator
MLRKTQQGAANMTTNLQLATHNGGAVSSSQNKCAVCGLKNLCLPVGLNDAEVSRLDKIIGRRRRVERDENLCRMEQPFNNLYAVRFGHFKTSRVNHRGEQQITGFQMAGELLGMDAIGTGQHGCGVVALEDSEVCEIPFARLQELFADVPQLLQHFHRIMSQEIMREQNAMMFLANMRAEQRFALFLLNLSTRYAARGYSPNSYQLRMSREDIGDYLGLTIESISRLLSRFRSNGWIRVDKRDLTIVDRASLEALATGADQDGTKVAAKALGRTPAVA